jgi:hypothetical protein
MYRAAEPAGQFAEVVQIQPVVLVCEKTGAAVVATLDDVSGNACQGNTGATRHGLSPEVWIDREVSTEQKTWSVPYSSCKKSPANEAFSARTAQLVVY